MTAELAISFRTQAFINGTWMDAADGATFDRVSPATGQVFTHVASGGPADIDRAVRVGRAAFEDGRWSSRSPGERKRVLLAFAQLIEENAAEIAMLDTLDAGKPICDCEDVDIPDVINTIRWYAEAVDKVFGKVSPTSGDALGLIVREPVGVVGAVLPWNFPASMLAWKLAPALAAGNSLVVKPAELAPLSALRMAELAVDAGLPEGVFNVVPGLGHTAGRALGLHMDLDAVTFTGSSEVGRMFLNYSAQSNLKGVTLECGGKSPQIVLADNVDRLETVADDLVEAAFWNSGQNCTAGSRILVEHSVKDQFVDLVAERARARVVGDPANRSTQIGPLIEAQALDRVLGAIHGAVQQGARVVSGGERVLTETGGFYVGATVLDDVSPTMAVAREEIFGPVTAVLGFDDVAEAVAMANDSTYGLAATVWSSDIDAALGVARQLRAGTVAVNGYSEGDVSTPFGGYKASGFGGRDKGLEALEQYTELKTIWIAQRPIQSAHH